MLSRWKQWVVLGVLLLGFSAVPARASILISLSGHTPGSTQFDYTISFTPTSGDVLLRGDYITIYDFIPTGLFGGVSAIDVPGWNVSLDLTGPTPQGAVVTDSPDAFNATFTYDGATSVSVATSFAPFHLFTSGNLTGLQAGQFAGTTSGVSISTNTFVGDVQIPGLALPPTTSVPEPSTITLGLVSLALLGVTQRYRRK